MIETPLLFGETDRTVPDEAPATGEVEPRSSLFGATDLSVALQGQLPAER